MLKKILLASVLFVSVLALSGQHYTDKDMTPRQVMERANEYYHKGELTEALEGFNLLVNTPVKSMDALEAGLIIEAHNKAAIVNYHEGNYRHAYELLARALSLSEETGHAAELVKIYTNIGNIYYRFEAYERARTYYLRALSMQNDSVSIAGLYNNIGMLEANGAEILHTWKIETESMWGIEFSTEGNGLDGKTHFRFANLPSGLKIEAQEYFGEKTGDYRRLYGDSGVELLRLLPSEFDVSISGYGYSPFYQKATIKHLTIGNLVTNKGIL